MRRRAGTAPVLVGLIMSKYLVRKICTFIGCSIGRIAQISIFVWTQFVIEIELNLLSDGCDEVGLLEVGAEVGGSKWFIGCRFAHIKQT